jgi:hypothetical protein
MEQVQAFRDRIGPTVPCGLNDLSFGAPRDRFDELDFNLFVFAVSVSEGEPDLTVARQMRGGVRRAIRVLPAVRQTGGGDLLRYRERYGLTYHGVSEMSMIDLAKVIKRLRSA